MLKLVRKYQSSVLLVVQPQTSLSSRYEQHKNIREKRHGKSPALLKEWYKASATEAVSSTALSSVHPCCEVQPILKPRDDSDCFGYLHRTRWENFCINSIVVKKIQNQNKQKSPHPTI